MNRRRFLRHSALAVATDEMAGWKKQQRLLAVKSRAEKAAPVMEDPDMFRQLVLAVKELRSPPGTSSDDEPIFGHDNMQE
jgi:hypothetical protein